MDVYDLATELIKIVYSSDFSDQGKIKRIKEVLDKYVEASK